MVPAALESIVHGAQGWGRLWALRAELALPSLSVGDRGDTAAGDRDTRAVPYRVPA